jgi:probable F420-dependent oxidoreductase
LKFGVVVPTYELFGDGDAIREVITEAESLAFDSVWVSDRVVVPGYSAHITPPDWFEAMTTISQGLALTSRVSFGTDVLVTPYRHPLLLAKMAATLIALSGPRLTLGLGVGYLRGEFDALGAEFSHRGAVTEEYLKVLRLLFDATGPVSFDGRWVRFEDIHFGPVPSARPPLLVGGNVERVITRAALWGDGWHPLFPSLESYAAGRSRIIALRKEAGIETPFLFSYSCPHGQVIADDAGAASPPHRDVDGYLPPVPVDESGRRRFTGTAQQLREDFGALRAVGVEQAIVRFYIPGDTVTTRESHIEQMRRFSADVIEPVRTRLA